MAPSGRHPGKTAIGADKHKQYGQTPNCTSITMIYLFYFYVFYDRVFFFALNVNVKFVSSRKSERKKKVEHCKRTHLIIIILLNRNRRVYVIVFNGGIHLVSLETESENEKKK